MRSPVSCLRPRPPSVRNSGDAFSAVRPGGRDIGIKIVFEQMVRRHLVLLAAFLVKPHPPALALRVIVLDVHVQGGRDPGEAIYKESNQGAVAQPDDRRHVDTSTLSMSLRASSPSSTGVLPFLTIWLGPRTGAAGFWSTSWPTISQSNSRRMAARCCLTVGAL